MTPYSHERLLAAKAFLQLAWTVEFLPFDACGQKALWVLPGKGAMPWSAKMYVYHPVKGHTGGSFTAINYQQRFELNAFFGLPDREWPYASADLHELDLLHVICKLQDLGQVG